jgi:4-diphosphocytidyl-2-C-methyl-D-erythritol kinase
VKVELLAENRVRVEPPAKLNLFLAVLGKRSDGYHEIETVMQTISLRDVLIVERGAAPEITIRTLGYPAPTDATNLVWRAADAFFAATHQRFGVSFDLEKNIPAGAGLGGGSADAAGALAALNTLAGHPLDTAALSELAATIGSDVPFFLTGGTAIARGRGEILEALDDAAIPEFEYVLLFPRETSPTALIYKSLTSDLTMCKRDLHRWLRDLTVATRERAPAFFNALAIPFRAVFPALAKLQDEITVATRHPFHVTGSGSAMFAVVANRDEGTEVERVLQAMAAGDTFLVRSLPR